MKRMWSKNEVKNLSKEVIESGVVDNAKPIYYHGLEFYDGVKNNLFYAHILSNSAEEINSLEKFLTWIRSFDKLIVVECSGMLHFDGDNSTYNLYSIYKRANENTLNMIATTDNTTYSVKSNIDLTDMFNTFNDGVNKIN